jgi:DNA-binding NarL/FixJ family response regulator
VRQANRVEQAWQVAQEWTPEVVFLDLNLRGSFDGLALGEQLRRLLPQARLVALSGSMRQDIHERLVAARFDGFLSKPVDIHDLLPFC